MNDLTNEKRQDILSISERYGGYNIRVIGSVARGEATPESDLDLLVRFQPGRSLFDHAALKRELENMLGCKVDVANENGLRNRVRERVMKEALPL